MKGGAIERDLAMAARVLSAAQWRGKGFYEYLYELQLARERFGPLAADEQLALDLELMKQIDEHRQQELQKRRHKRGRR